MFAALWLLMALVGGQHFGIVSGDFVIGDPSSIYQAASNFNPSKIFGTFQQVQEIPQSLSFPKVPVFGNMELPFAAPSRARQPSRPRQGQQRPNENQQVLTNAEQLASEELQRVTTSEPEISPDEQMNSENEIPQVVKEKLDVQKRPYGGSYKFCNQFGCHDCKPPGGAKCCDGFKYDRKANRCRELL